MFGSYHSQDQPGPGDCCLLFVLFIQLVFNSDNFCLSSQFVELREKKTT